MKHAKFIFMALVACLTLMACKDSRGSDEDIEYASGKIRILGQDSQECSPIDVPDYLPPPEYEGFELFDKMEELGGNCFLTEGFATKSRQYFRCGTYEGYVQVDPEEGENEDTHKSHLIGSICPKTSVFYAAPEHPIVEFQEALKLEDSLGCNKEMINPQAFRMKVDKVELDCPEDETTSPVVNEYGNSIPNCHPSYGADLLLPIEGPGEGNEHHYEHLRWKAQTQLVRPGEMVTVTATVQYYMGYAGAPQTANQEMQITVEIWCPSL